MWEWREPVDPVEANLPDGKLVCRKAPWCRRGVWVKGVRGGSSLFVTAAWEPTTSSAWAFQHLQGKQIFIFGVEMSGRF